jgi:hypothetical protein
VDGAGLADEPGPEHVEDAFGLHERPPEGGGGGGVVGVMGRVVGERDGVGELDEYRPDLRGQVHRLEQPGDLGVELLHRLRGQLHAAALPSGGGDVEPVLEEVEVDGEAASGFCRHQGRADST